jgi:hypothetical protein
VKGLKNIYQANGPRTQAGITISSLGKVDFKPKLIRRDKEGHFILIEGAINQEETSSMFVTLYK